MNNFIFDVDGTLTPSRSKINPGFEHFFLNFCKKNRVYLVTGSDRPKTIEQVGDRIYNAANRVYQCSGSDVYEKSRNVFRSEFKIASVAKDWLKNELANSKFPLRTGNHIEERPGMVNFSIVGRNATTDERELYVKWDTATEERIKISRTFNYIFAESDSNIKATVGGDTGLDIGPLGSDKSQILRDFAPNEKIIFFGDKMHTDGNDYPLARELDIRNALNGEQNVNYAVNDWEHTFKILNKYI